MRTFILALVSLVFGVTARTAAADEWRNPYTGTMWNNPMSSLADTMIRGKLMENAWKNWYGKKNGTAAASAPVAPVAHQPYTKTDFKPGKQHLVVDAIISGLAQNAQQKQGLMQGMDAVFQQYEKSVRKNNVAYAMAFMIGAALVVQTGQTIDDAQGEQLAQGINDALAANPAFANASAADRQKLYEAFVTMGGLVVLFNEVGKKDPASANAAKLLAKQALAMLGAS
jgi:hypothetical protein